MKATSKFVWMNGALTPFENASLHFLTAGFHYGIAVFEGIRCYETDAGPAIFRLKEHIDRLFGSASVLGFSQLPYTREQLMQACRQTVAANGFGDCYIRPVIYLAEGGWNLNLDGGHPHAGIAVWKWDAFYGKEMLETGLRANISSFTRHHPNVSMTKAKISGNYVNSVMAKTESARLGFDEAIMLDPSGYVAECTGENIFLARNGVVYTPHGAAILEGITRDAIMTLARDMGLRVVEQPVSRDQLYLADEVFVCGTAGEVMALREIDFRKIGAGQRGPLTRKLQEAFAALTRGRHHLSASWLDHVSPLEMGYGHGV